jgi:2-polyprenyl-6-methoxyphenol hydroxylase-like FAD-dependent oxidoreductase
MQSDVLILGAGPTGLTAAVMLARMGVHFRIIDTKERPATDSRATIVHSRTLEIWDKLGFADYALTQGERIERTALMRNGKTFAVLPISGAESDLGTPYPFSLIFEQPKTEQMMARALEGQGHRVEWRTSFVEMREDRDAMVVTLEAPDGQREIVRCAWVIASDGAHSRAREQLGLQFSGRTHEQLAFVADAELDAPDEYRERVTLNYFKEGYVGFVPLKASRSRRLFRVFGVVPDELEGKMRAEWNEGVKPEDLTYIFRERLHTPVRVLHSKGAGLYRLHSRLVERYRVGRCFLAGDAAHVHTPAGGQGMNTGIQDAHNLAWKLALVIHGIARPGLLDSYESERRAVAEAVIRGTDVAFAVEATKNPLLQIFNNHLMPSMVRVASRFAAFRRYGARVFTQAWIHYRNSPAVSAPPSLALAVQPGDRAPNERFEAGPQPGCTLFELMRGHDHHALVFEGHRTTIRQSADSQLATLRQAFATYSLPVNVHFISAADRAIHTRYGVRAPTLMLIRPDGHIAYVGAAASVSRLQAYLDRWFLRASAAREAITGR